MYLEWRKAERTGLRESNEIHTKLVEPVKQFLIYESWVIPGLLQTRAYTTAVLNMVTDVRDIPDDVAAAVDVRMRRQRMLHQGDHRFAAVLEESVLYTRIGGVSTMIEQLRHLAKLSRTPSLSLGIIPMTTDRKLWPVESFYVHDQIRVTSELIAAFLTITQRSQVRDYTKTFERLQVMATYGVEARKLIDRATAALTA